MCVAALAVLVTVPVFAKVVANATRTSLFIGSGTFLMPLTDGGALTLGFNGKGKHAISYSAECTGSGTWVSIQIVVDGVAVAPTGGTDDAFCSDFDGNGGLNGWMTSHYRVVTPSLALGAHAVSVQVTANGGSARLDDASLIVEK